ncbi:glycosyltransferase [uncultured Draconibacterium sp.]|uniref:glycosyltransferase n=1 Tax=uncultured Draconibacterium sp. TaxID=1573823 RepID=UPI0025FD01D8|nr:glycosyltransferase [uncultured Draconibacterium sp.]
MIQNLFDTFYALSVLQWTVVAVAFLLWFGRFLYLLLLPLRLVFRKSNTSVEKKEPLSVLVLVRNEAENCRETLPRLLNLKAEGLEVVAVDDFSQDNTLSVLGLLKQQYGNLKISSLSQETRYSEKLAQNVALKSATNNWVLVYPVAAQNVSAEWLSGMSKVVGTGVEIKIGYSTIEPQKGWFNKLYRIENFFQQLGSAGYVLNRLAFVYNEENIAFKKETYFKLGGYGAKVQEPFANLELVINRFISRKKAELIFKAETAIVKKVEVNRLDFKNLLRKSIRIDKHLSTWKRLVLNADLLSEAMYPLGITTTLAFVFPIWPLVGILVVLKLLVFMVIIKILQNRLNERKLFITSLVFSFIRPYYKLIFRWHFNRISRNYKWKNKG